MKKVLFGLLGLALATSAMATTGVENFVDSMEVTGTLSKLTAPTQKIKLVEMNGGFNFGEITVEHGQSIDSLAKAITGAKVTDGMGQDLTGDDFYYKIANKDDKLEEMLNSSWWGQNGNERFANIWYDEAGQLVTGSAFGAKITGNGNELTVTLSGGEAVPAGNYTAHGVVYVALPDAFEDVPVNLPN